MNNSDESVGRAIRSLREAARMSQAQLATALTELGLDGFYPQTVTKIEQGTRALKYLEALQVAAIFGVDAGGLVPQTEDQIDPEVVLADMREVCETWKVMLEAMQAHLDVTVKLGTRTAEHVKMPEDLRAMAQDLLFATSLDSADEQLKAEGEHFTYDGDFGEVLKAMAKWKRGDV